MAQANLSRVLQAMRRLVGGSDPDAESDGALLARHRAGDQAAFAALVRRHGGLVWNVCQRVLGDRHHADDAFQATFLVLLRRADRLDGSRSLAGWLQAVALRTAVRARADAARRREREALVPELDMSSRTEEASWQLLRPVLDEELARLPDKYRQPVVLCYLEGKTNDEAAGILGWTRGTVAGRLSRARDLLRQRLTRRQITLAPALVFSLIAARAQAAAVPEASLRAAFALGAGQAVPESVQQLAKGVLVSMKYQQFKNVALYAAAAVVAIALAGAVYTAVVPVDNKGNPKEAGSKPVNGLKLTLSAVKDTTTRMVFDVEARVPLNEGKNAMPVELMLTLTNVSDQPIKLDTYDMNWKLAVTGPDADSVRTAQALADILRVPPTAADYPILAPGKTWQRPVKFPGNFANAADASTIYYLMKTGAYRLHASYDHPKVTPHAPAKGSWTGVVESNELVITVK
ncbi:MAG: RNA polymerase sigma factor [Gemmataceae bacterium]